MIASELREADPASISPLPANTTGVTFTKFHNPRAPGGETQVVTWQLDAVNHRVSRSYTVGGLGKPSATFGDNIMDLRFNGTTKTEYGCPLTRINIMMDTQSEVVSPAGGRRKIIKLAQDVYLRQDQPIILDIYYISP